MLLLPPPAASTDGTPATEPPTLRLPAHFAPRPDPYAALKKYTGRTLDRLVGYCWWLLVFLGAGSPVVGVGNFVLGLGVWSWWRARPSIALDV